MRLQSDAHRHLSLKDSSKIDAKEYLSEVCALLQRTLQGIRPVQIVCEAADTLIDPQKALALGLITNELVTNATKHAFGPSESGRINVSLRRDEFGRVRLSVTDNGVGCPEDAKSGTGTALVKALVQEYRGTFSRENKERGCEVTIALPPKQP